jgi:hypothetical protein
LGWLGSDRLQYGGSILFVAGIKKSGVAKPEWLIREEQGYFKSYIASHVREYLKGRNKATLFVVDNEAFMRKALLHPVEIT